MQDEITSRKQPNINIPAASWVTRKLLRGGGHEVVIDKICKEFEVRINSRISQQPLINVRGPSSTVIDVVRGLIAELDQKANVIVNQYKIYSKNDITDEHYNQMRGHLDTLLPKAKRELNALQQQSSDSKIAQDTPHTTDDSANTSQFFDNAVPSKTRPSKAEKKAMRNNAVAGSIKLPDAFQPRNESQAITYLACKDPEISLVFAAGPFGGGKTYTPLRAAFEAVAEGRVSEIIIIRPTTTASGLKAGAMPGDARKKMDPYVKGGIESNVFKITNQTMAHFEQRKVLRALTPDFERGETYDNAFIVVDEPQNLTMSQAELLIGRLGEGSIMAFAGDIGGNQNDLRGEMPGLAHLIATQGAATRTDKVLDRAAAFIAFKPEDSAARNGILPHVARALNEPPKEYGDFMKTIRETKKDFALAQAIDGAREYAVSVLKEAADRTFARYQQQAKETFPQLYASNVVNLPTGSTRKLG